MFKNLFNSIFKKEETPNTTANDIDILNEISNGLGEYADCSFNEKSEAVKNKKAQEMLSQIIAIKGKNTNTKDSNLSYALAIAYKNYCAWFVRGNEREKYLNKALSHLKQAITYNSSNTEAKAELGKLLIEEKTIRDLHQGLSVLQELKDNGNLPTPLNSILSKALRQNNDINLDTSYNLCIFTDPSPAVFREERKRFRELIRKFKKEKNDKDLEVTLNQYYQLSVLVTACYGNHNCNSGVAGQQYENAIKLVKNICKKIKYSYQENGKISQSSFISDNDWKTFIKVFGDNQKSLTVNL